MKKFLASIVISTVCAVIPHAFALTASVQEKVNQCRNLTELQSRNVCFFNVAINTESVEVCNLIEWSVQTSVCRRDILLKTPDTSRIFTINNILFLLLFVWIVLFFALTPRTPFIYSAVAGIFVSVVYFLTESSVNAFLRVVQHFLHIVLLPMQPFVVHVPTLFLFLPEYAYITLVISAYISIVFGLLFQFTKKATQIAVLFLIITTTYALYSSQYTKLFSHFFRVLRLLFT